MATTDPEKLPERKTWYLVTNLPHPSDRSERSGEGDPAAAELAEVVGLYGLRMWVEQSYKQVKHVLGWSDYQVRSDLAMRRHWQLVCCAFSFCWWAYGRLPAYALEEPAETENPTSRPNRREGKKRRPLLSSPKASRAVRGWLEPWIMLGRYWRAFTDLPPPKELRALLERVFAGEGIYLYVH